MQSTLDSKKGTYHPMWMDVAEITRQPVLPELMAELVMKTWKQGWPEKTLVVTDLPSDDTYNI